MKPSTGDKIRVRGLHYRHKITRLYYVEGVGKFAVVQQIGGRNHGKQRTVDRAQIRGVR